ncbi:MAG: DUF58 domain-containing protein [Spirochaetales bacterium]|nr:DUF58 domain-containing protein [Spirochaetales bacterium]
METTSFFNKVKKIEIIASRLVENLLSGNYRSVFKGQGIEFDEVREYVPGDDVRLIDWNVTSRMNNPFTKMFREERELTLFLVVDSSASIFSGSGKISKNELICLVFAILGLSAIMNNDKVGCVFFTDRIEKWVPPAKGERHILSVINNLLIMKPSGRGSDMSLALKTVCESLKRRGIVVIISDFKTDGYFSELTYVSRRHDVIALNVFDPVDVQIPESGLIEMEDPESGKIMVSSGNLPSFRNNYAKFRKIQRDRWLTQCHLRGVETLEISTSEDAGMKLYQFFKKRKKRR